MNWTRVTRAENIPPREGRPVRIGGLEIAVFNLNGRFLTVENACPHRGGPLCDGIVTGTSVVCPLHGRHFDLETGVPTRSSEPACLNTYPTCVEDGIVMVDLTAARNLGAQQPRSAAQDRNGIARSAAAPRRLLRDSSEEAVIGASVAS